jgi:hypothetical protein
MNFSCGITCQALELILVITEKYRTSNKLAILFIKLDKMDWAYKSLPIHHHTLTKLNVFQIRSRF